MIYMYTVVSQFIGSLKEVQLNFIYGTLVPAGIWYIEWTPESLTTLLLCNTCHVKRSSTKLMYASLLHVHTFCNCIMILQRDSGSAGLQQLRLRYRRLAVESVVKLRKLWKSQSLLLSQCMVTMATQNLCLYRTMTGTFLHLAKWTSLMLVILC